MKITSMEFYQKGGHNKPVWRTRWPIIKFVWMETNFKTHPTL